MIKRNYFVAITVYRPDSNFGDYRYEGVFSKRSLFPNPKLLLADCRLEAEVLSRDSSNRRLITHSFNRI